MNFFPCLKTGTFTMHAVSRDCLLMGMPEPLYAPYHHALLLLLCPRLCMSSHLIFLHTFQCCECASASVGPHPPPFCAPPQAPTPVPTGFPAACICSPKSALRLGDSPVSPDALFSISPTDILKQHGIWVKTGHWFCNKLINK